MAARPALPTSTSDFALPPSTSSIGLGGPGDEFNPLLLRFRRPSLLAPPRASFYSESRLNSPLAGSSFSTRRHKSSGSVSMSGEESESDREKMWADTHSSGSNTPATPSIPGPSTTFAEKDKSTTSVDSDSSMKSNSSESSAEVDTGSNKTAEPLSSATPSQPARVEPEVLQAPLQIKNLRHTSHPQIKMPRILTLLSESNPEENEVKSEAQFQKFVSSFSNHPRTPRALLDRGRYPEEAGEEEFTREDSPSDDEDDPGTAGPFSYPSIGSEPVNIPSSTTPAHSVNGDDFGLSESPSNNAMDIDTQPSSTCGSPKLTSWRYTPPPTSTSAVRTNKRKLDDRYDPYPSAKRRAVSPSVSYLRDSQPSLFAPRTPSGNRVPLPHPIAIPNIPSSGASSPVVTPSGLSGSRPLSWGPLSVLSSPTLRAQNGLASPVLRPMMRRREEREVDGAGEGVHGLTLE